MTVTQQKKTQKQQKKQQQQKKRRGRKRVVYSKGICTPQMESQQRQPTPCESQKEEDLVRLPQM